MLKGFVMLYLGYLVALGSNEIYNCLSSAYICKCDMKPYDVLQYLGQVKCKQGNFSFGLSPKKVTSYLS